MSLIFSTERILEQINYSDIVDNTNNRKDIAQSNDSTKSQEESKENHPPLLGTLIGPLPQFNQQNAFRGLPCLLSEYEDSNISSSPHNNTATSDGGLQLLTREKGQFTTVANEISVQDVVAAGGIERYLKQQSTAATITHVYLPYGSNVARLPLKSGRPVHGKQQERRNLMQLIYNDLTRPRRLVEFKSANSKPSAAEIPADREEKIQPWLLPGSKFGGQWCLYLGYPGRFHSVAIVHCCLNTDTSTGHQETNDDSVTVKQQFTFRDIVHWGRIANVTHKTALIAGFTQFNRLHHQQQRQGDTFDSQNIVYFSVRWSGW